MRPITASAVECVSFVSIEMRHHARARRLFAERARVVVPDVPAFDHPALELGRPGVQDEECDQARLPAGSIVRAGAVASHHSLSGGCAGARACAAMPGARGPSGRTSPFADISALRQLHHLPAPLEDRRRAKVDVNLLRDRRWSSWLRSRSPRTPSSPTTEKSFRGRPPGVSYFFHPAGTPRTRPPAGSSPPRQSLRRRRARWTRRSNRDPVGRGAHRPSCHHASPPQPHSQPGSSP